MISGRLVFLVRVVGAVSFGFIGLVIGGSLAAGDSGIMWIIFWAAPPLGLAVFGALATPLIMLPILNLFQEMLDDIKPLQLFLGTLGVIAGLLVSIPLSLALAELPGVGSFIGPFAVSVLLGSFGAAAMVSREDQLTSLLGRYVPNLDNSSAPRQVVLDTSAIIDGRIADIAESGFLHGEIIVPRFILDELRHVADSSEDIRRQRGRRGLEVLGRLQREPSLTIHVSETDFSDARDVDAKLLRLAKELGANILTNDFNLHQIAELENIKVLNVNQLANAVKVVVLPGEDLNVQITQEGKEKGQGVAFLEDGTMVVVEEGDEYLQQEIDIVVTRVLQTTAGRMIFAQPKVNK